MKSLSARFALLCFAVVLAAAALFFHTAARAGDAPPAAPDVSARQLPQAAPQAAHDPIDRSLSAWETGAADAAAFLPMIAPVPVVGQWAALAAALAAGIASVFHAVRSVRRDRRAAKGWAK